MEINDSDQTVDAPEYPLQTPPVSPLSNYRKGLFFILGVLLLLGVIGSGFYVLAIQNSSKNSQTPNPSATTAEMSLSSSQQANSTPITLTNITEAGPTIVQQTYPVERVNVGGQTYNATQIVVSAQLFIPEEDDYSIFSSFNNLGSVTTIDGREGPAYQSEFHLTTGNHDVQITYIDGKCLPTDYNYIEKTYGTEAKPLDIYFAIRKKSKRQTIPNYTIFDNPLRIRNESKPYKGTDLYMHCQNN